MIRKLSGLLAGDTLGALVRFGAGGVLSSGITLGVTALLHEIFAVDEPIAAAVGFAGALVVNFFFLRHVVFKGAQTSLRRQLILFAGSTGVFRALEYAAFFVLNVVFHVRYLIALIAVLATSFLVKFFIYERYVFAGRNAKGTTRANTR